MAYLLGTLSTAAGLILGKVAVALILGRKVRPL